MKLSDTIVNLHKEKMKKIALLILLCLSTSLSWAQETVVINGKVLNDADDTPLENVNIVNLNSVRGTTSTREGDFAIRATVNDTLYFSYLGFKSIRVRVTNDWLKFGEIKIKMTELGIALPRCSTNARVSSAQSRIPRVASIVALSESPKQRISGEMSRYSLSASKRC